MHAHEEHCKSVCMCKLQNQAEQTIRNVHFSQACALKHCRQNCPPKRLFKECMEVSSREPAWEVKWLWGRFGVLNKLRSIQLAFRAEVLSRQASTGLFSSLLSSPLYFPFLSSLSLFSLTPSLSLSLSCVWLSLAHRLITTCECSDDFVEHFPQDANMALLLQVSARLSSDGKVERC